MGTAPDGKSGTMDTLTGSRGQSLAIQSTLRQAAILIRDRPLCACCVAYVLGAGLDLWGLALNPAALGLFAACVPLAVVVTARSMPTTRWLRAPFICLCLGVCVAAGQMDVKPTDVSRLAGPHRVIVEGVTISEPRIYPFGCTLQMECRRVICGGRIARVTGKALVWQAAGAISTRPVATSDWIPLPGQRVRLGGHLSSINTLGPARASFMRRQGIYATLQSGKTDCIQILPGSEGDWRAGCIRVRNRLLAGMEPFLGRREMGALRGMLFHQTDEAPQGALDDLQRTGTMHIMASAGLHVGLVLGLCLATLSWLLPRRAAVGLTMVFLVAYCVACGGWPAVLRATLVAELGLAAWLLGRLPDIATCLALAATCMVVRNPAMLEDPGFQFTFLTVGVMLILIPAALKRSPEDSRRTWVDRLGEGATSMAWLSFGAQVGSWPLTLFYFGMVSFVGIPANILIVPLLALIIPLALLTGILGNLYAPFAVVPGFALQEMVHFLLWLAHQLGGLPGACLSMDGTPAVAVALYYGVLFGVVGWWRLRESVAVAR